jgi:3',5'-cyclic AMP phosphodiesterase CpdA
VTTALLIHNDGERGFRVNGHPKMKLTRRQALTLGACGLLAGAFPLGSYLWGRDRGQASGREEFSFAVANDLHVMGEDCGAWLERVFRHMRARAEPIDFCLVVGDLAHDGTPDQLRVARAAFDRAGIPVYPVIGNHDHNHPAGRRTYEELFPDRINYSFEHKGWQFVGLDSTDGPRWEDAFPIRDHTLQWLNTNLPRLDRQKPTVLFTHFPLGPDIWGQATNALEVLGRFRGHDLRSAFTGHAHRITWREVGGVTITTNRCCSFREPNHDGVRDKAYFVCRANADGTVSRRFVAGLPA